MSDYQSILENLGYKLTDRGSFWHTNAVYRGGDNPTAVQIYKNSGVWKDFVEDTDFMPFEMLVGKTLNTTDTLKIREVLKGKAGEQERHAKKDLLKAEKTYDVSCLKKLLPHYDFYLQKGISLETLQDYRCGLATSGKFYQRMVFPIFNKEGRIHGFSGRKVNEKNESPKWLHVGKKSNWFYPYYSVPKIAEEIDKKKSVFLVESIGDSLSLYDAGVRNNLVSCGVAISSKFIAHLSFLDLDKIFVSMNNDFDSEEKRNRGFEGAFKVVVKLLESVDFQKIYFAPPPKNDFGVMSSEEIKAFHDEAQNLNHKLCMSQIIDFGKQTHANNHLPASFHKGLKDLCKLYKFHYG